MKWKYKKKVYCNAHYFGFYHKKKQKKRLLGFIKQKDLGKIA